jgi:outer membrane lipoprotein carrier protein
MRRHSALIILPAAIIALCTAAWAVTGDEAVSRMKGRIYSISTMRGTISIKSTSKDNLTGKFRYMAPGKFVIDLTEPSGKKIATNGKKLWVFDRVDKVCGVQDVDTTFSGGIASYVNGYTATASPSGASDTVIRLRGSNRTYRDVIIQVDGSFMPKVIQFKTEDGKGFTATLSGIVLNEPMAPSLFEFDPPAGSQVVKNPLNVR